MLAEVGHIFLIIAFFLFAMQIFCSLNLYTFNFRYSLLVPLKRVAVFSFAMVLCSFFVLIISYISSDFSILNVYNNTHTNKPLIYKLTGTWGNHEGSLLMWLSILAIYGLVFIYFIKKVPEDFSFKVLFTISIINFGFIGFTIFTSNPFLRIFPIPEQGLGLNPVLQDPGLAFHPPLLYFGYVGLTIPFAYAIAALLQEEVSPSWAKLVRPWILTSWIFLTLGITLGSWWAYYELGWGGWWFWDPVENISLLPWLLTTALLHSVRVTEKRDRLKSWTILLSILSFSLTLLGTFIVRSGLLTSVHAFASDPARGVFILGFLVLITGLSLLLYAFKLDKIENKKYVFLVSREGGLLLNNIFLCASAATILLGTLWPLVIEVTTGDDISVGAPYYKIVFLPLIFPAIFLSGISINLNWKNNSIEYIHARLWKVIFILLFFIIAYYLMIRGPLLMLLGVAASLWIFLTVTGDFLNKLSPNTNSSRVKIRNIMKIRSSTYGMYVAHIGVAIFILGATISEGLKTYYEGVNKIGSNIQIADFSINFIKVQQLQKENWVSEKGIFSINKNNNNFEMQAERRIYLDTGMPTTEAAIKRNLASHLYIVMGQEQPKGSGNRIVRVYYNPYVIFIWLGAFVMAIGGLLSLLDTKNSLFTKKRKVA